MCTTLEANLVAEGEDDPRVCGLLQVRTDCISITKIFANSKFTAGVLGFWGFAL